MKTLILGDSKYISFCKVYNEKKLIGFLKLNLKTNKYNAYDEKGNKLICNTINKTKATKVVTSNFEKRNHA